MSQSSQSHVGRLGDELSAVSRDNFATEVKMARTPEITRVSCPLAPFVHQSVCVVVRETDMWVTHNDTERALTQEGRS